MERFILLVLFCLPLNAALAIGTAVEGPSLITGQVVKMQAKETHKTLVVTFLSAKCPCSNSHIQELKDLALTYKDIQFVAVHSNSDEPKEMALNYFKEKNLPFPIIQDLDSKLANEFKAQKTPHTFVISPNGEVLYRGGVTDSAHGDAAHQKFLRLALEDIENHRPVKITEGRTLGCSISRGTW